MNMLSRRAFSGLAAGASAFVAAVGGGWPVRSALAVSPGLRDYGKAPEFAYEKSTRNVQDAIERFGIRYPVAQDNGFATWKAYDNQYWPAFYLVDAKGQVMRRQFGEGEYAEMEAAIEALLARRQPA